MFHITLQIGRRLFWEIDRRGMIEIPDATGARRGVISFDAHDHRLACARPRSESAGRRAFMQEWGESVRVVNLSRELHAQYGRDPRHGPARPAGCALFSGLQLMDRMAAARAVSLEQRVLGLRLGVPDGPGRTLVLLFAYDACGELARFQEAANPPSLTYLVDDFCRGLPLAATPEVAWFDYADVIAALPGMRPYPDEEMLAGVPLWVWWARARRASHAVTATAAVLALACAWQLWQAGAAAARDRADGAALQTGIEQGLRMRAHTLARIASAPTAVSFSDAEALWQPGSRVRLLSRPGRTEYDLVLEVLGAESNTAAGPGDAVPNVLSAGLGERARRALPAGMRALETATRGDLNAYYLRFERATALPAIAALAGAQP